MPKGGKPDHSWGANEEHHALVCLLRGSEFGKKLLQKDNNIQGVNARTTGPPLLAALCKRFLRVEVTRTSDVPGADAGPKGSNEHSMSMFKLQKVPGRPAKTKVERKKKPIKPAKEKRPKRVRLPKGLRRNTFTSMGNRVVKAPDVAMMQVRAQSEVAAAAPTCFPAKSR